jgi:hypothetical protein
MKTNNPSSKLVKEFLRESNYIERVYDDVALEDAYKAWRYLIKKEELTLILILKTHGILMKLQLIGPLRWMESTSCIRPIRR